MAAWPDYSSGRLPYAASRRAIFESLKAEKVLMDATIANRDVRYNVFRHKFDPELCCAVPEDRPVPRFLNGRWEYAGASHSRVATLQGFDSAAAEWGVHLTGFHLFHVAPKRSSLAINPEAPTKQCPSLEETVCAYRVQSPTVIVTHAAYPRVLWDSAAQNRAGQTNVTAVSLTLDFQRFLLSQRA